MIRRLKTKEEIERKRKRNQLLLGGGLVVLLLLSTAGFSLMNVEDSGTGSKVSENGLDFYSRGNYWITILGGREYIFENLPSEISDVEINGEFGLNDYSGQVLYFTKIDQGTNVIVNNLDPYLLRYQEACIEGQAECREDLPIKTCNDFIVIVSEEEETRLWKEDNCIYLSGDTVKAADAFVYKTLGIL